MSSCSYEGYQYLWMSSYSCAEKKSHEHLLIYRDAHARAATHVQKKIHSWAAAHIGVPMHEQLLMCKKNDTHEQLIIEEGFPAWAATHVQRKHDIHEQLLTYLYIYRGTHAWAAAHVQKNKWHSWAAAHIQGYLCMSSYSCAEKNDTYEQLLMCKKKWHSGATAQNRGTHAHEQLLMCRKKTVMSSCSCRGTRAWAAAHECKMNFIMHEQNLRGGNPCLRCGNTRLRGGFTRSWFLGIMGVKKT